MHELSKPTIRYRVPLDSVALGPALFRQVVGPEEPIEQGEVDREIAIEGVALGSVMPVMELRCHE